jgi:hypothetical protein
MTNKSIRSFDNNSLNTPDISSESFLHNLVLSGQTSYYEAKQKSVNYQEEQQHLLTSTNIPFDIQITSSNKIDDDFSINHYLGELLESCPPHIFSGISRLLSNSIEKALTSTSCDKFSTELQLINEKEQHSNNKMNELSLKRFISEIESYQLLINDKAQTSAAVAIEVQPLSESNKLKEPASSSTTANEKSLNNESNKSKEEAVQSIKKKRERNSSSISKKQKVQQNQEDEQDEEDFIYFGNRLVNKRTNYNEYKNCRLKNNEAVIRCRNKKKYEYDEKEKKLKELTDQNKELETKVIFLEMKLKIYESLLNQSVNKNTRFC